MTDDKRLDESISRLIQGIQLDIPPSIEEEINKKSVGARPYPDLPSYRRLLWTLLPSGAALILGGAAFGEWFRWQKDKQPVAI